MTDRLSAMVLRGGMERLCRHYNRTDDLNILVGIYARVLWDLTDEEFNNAVWVATEVKTTRWPPPALLRKYAAIPVQFSTRIH